MEYQIEIKPTNKPGIVKFEANRFLTDHESREYANIDQAKDSPLAQQLFHLPFVKTVFIAQNFVAIEKYSIVEWEEVQEDTAKKIQGFLNEGGAVIDKDLSPDRKVPISVYAESTPNPSVMKFVANKKIVLKTFEFKNIDEAKNSPLAQALFHFPFVREVFFDENYVSINKYDMADWGDITMELREFIREYLTEGKSIVADEAYSAPNQPANAVSGNPENLDETSREIVSILDEYVKPAVAGDGGNIVFESYDPEKKSVKVVLQGACSGCPSSTLTLKNGIETMLREMLDGKVSTVEAVNG